MAILAIYPQPPYLHLALNHCGQLISTKMLFSDPNSLEIDELIFRWLAENSAPQNSLEIIVTSGIYVSPAPSGLYLLNQSFLKNTTAYSQPENYGALVAQRLTHALGIPAYIVDPLERGEIPLQAAVTGTPELKRNNKADVFVFKYVTRAEAQKRKIPWERSRFVVANLNEELQIGAVSQGRIVDLTNSQDEGPFSLQQAGGLPFGPVLELSARLANEERTLQVLEKESGIRGYIGAKSYAELFQSKDSRAQLIAEALVYQVAKEIGAYAAVLRGRTDGIVLTGDLAREKTFLAFLRKRIEFLGDLAFYPGNQAFPALLAGAQRVKEQQKSI